MSNILIINGAKEFAHSKGQLNDTLTEVADGFLRDAGHDVKVVRTDGRRQIVAWIVDDLPVPARLLQRRDGKDHIDMRLQSVN